MLSNEEIPFGDANWGPGDLTYESLYLTDSELERFNVSIVLYVQLNEQCTNVKKGVKKVCTPH